MSSKYLIYAAASVTMFMAVSGVCAVPDLPTVADGPYDRQATWPETMLASRVRLQQRLPTAAASPAALIRPLWEQIKQDFPRQALWLERDAASVGPDALTGWFCQAGKPEVETGLFKNLVRILRGYEDTAQIEAEIAALARPAESTTDPRQLILYARLAEKVYGKRLGLHLVGEYCPPAFIEPVTPPIRNLSEAEAAALLEKDYLFQADGKPGLERITQEIGWGKSLAQRLGNLKPDLDFTPEMRAFAQLEKELARVKTASPATAEALKELYLAVRKIKRAIQFKNPVLDFTQLLLVDNPLPGGPIWDHESGQRHGFNARPGGRLLILDGLSPAGKVRLLAPEKPGSFLRPDLSFDGKKVVFSFKPHNEDAFHLYEIGIDGSGGRQITFGQYDDLDPIYLPDGRILFTSTRCHTYVRCLPCSPAFVITRCDADGKNIYILSQGNEPEFMPSLLADGRVIYTRWEYSDKALWRVQKLWTMNTDGTAASTFWGNQSVWPDVMTEARQIPGSPRVMFTGVGHHAWFNGCIGIVDQRAGFNFPHGLTKVTADHVWTESGNGPVDPLESTAYHAAGRFDSYKTPWPLGESDFLVSARVNGRFRLYLMDTDGNRELIYEGAHSILYAQPLKPRIPPPAIMDKVPWLGVENPGVKVPPGTLYSGDVFAGAPAGLKEKAKYLRVVQLDAKNYSTWFKAWQHQGPVVSLLQADGVKRILGIVPIQEDGSVNFELPPGRAVYFQLLDAQFRAIHSMRSFTGVMPDEHRGCVGCHESSSRVFPAAAKKPQAMRQETAKLVEPPWGAQTSISFERFAQPVLDKYCAGCHQGQGKARAKLDLTLRPSTVRWNYFANGPKQFGRDGESSPFKEPYVTLVGGAFGWTKVRQVTFNAAGVPTCLAGCLIPEGFGARDPRSLVTLPPLSYLSPASKLVEIASSGKHHGVKVREDDLLRLMAWVDLNCPFLGDEEIRQIPDPEFPFMECLPMRHYNRSAPHVNRAFSQEQYNSGEDRVRHQNGDGRQPIPPARF